MPTIAAALRSARHRFVPVSESASGDAQALLSSVLKVERAWLLAHPEQLLTPEQSAAFEALVARCAAGEPLPYVLGRRAWYDRDFIVTTDVLIPRPETESLLEAALRWAADAPTTDAQLGVATPPNQPTLPTDHMPVAVDVGTGSGIIAVTFAALRPEWHVYALDVSEAALSVARRNAVLHGVGERITFMQSDLLSAWRAGSPLTNLERGFRGEVDLLMANLPYIPSADVTSLPVAAHEPRLALDGGEDGLRLIERLLAQSRSLMRPGGLILLEIEARQGTAAAALVRAAFPGATVDVLRDYAGHDRIVRVKLVDGKNAAATDSWA